ncbi:MAG: WD40 repeat domain-containing protein [Leptolyngbya sp. SIO3F4]|nr:WD40 repeat domain-containing protein [Leptolyngbya sp. SIO3F4]
MATASEDKTVHLIDFKGNAVIPPVQHDEPAIDVHISDDNQSLATASLPFSVKLWDLSKQQQPIEWKVDEKRDGLIQHLQFSPREQHMVTATASGALELWDLAGNRLDSFIGHHESVHQISFSPDGQSLVSSSDDGTVRLWQVQPETFRHVHKPNDLGVVDISFDRPTGYLVTEDGPNLHIWDLEGQKVNELPGYEEGVAQAKLSADGQIAITLSNPTLSETRKRKMNLWQLTSGRPKPLNLELSEGVEYIDLSTDGDYLAIDLQSGGTQLWSLATSQPQFLFEAVGIATDLSADGQTMANLTAEGVVELFDPQGNLKTSFTHPDGVNPDDIWGIYLSSDGKFVITSTDTDMYLWDSQLNPKDTQSIPVPTVLGGDILAIAISPDGQWLALATETGAYTISTSGNDMAHLPHPAAVTTLQFSPDSKQLITLSADEDGTARVWQVETSQALFARSCQWVTPYLQTLSNQNLKESSINPGLCRNIPDE